MFGALMVAGWGPCGLAAAAELPKCPQAITFAFYENGYIYDAATDRGIDRDVADELARRSGCHFEYSVKPRARIWRELEIGTLMMTGSGIQTEARQAFAWSVRYMAQKNYVLVDKSLPVHSAANFLARPALSWGVVRAYKHGEAADQFLDELRRSGRVIEATDLESAFRALARNHTQAVMAPPPAYSKYLASLDLGERLRVEDWFTQDPAIPHALFFSKKYFPAEEMAKWQGIVAQMRADGTLRNIFRRHLSPQDAERMLQYVPD